MGEVAALTYADSHVGRATPTYDPDIWRTRMAALTRKLHRFSMLLGDHDIEELRVLVLGDVTDGSGIFRTQAYGQAITDPDEQGREWADYTASQLTELRQWYPRVSAYCVQGNHGRRGKDANPRSNSDANAYYFLRERLRGSGVDVDIAGKDENPSMRLLTLKGHRYLCYHGDGGGIAWTSIERRILLLNTTRLYRGFDVAIQGHTHCSWHRNINDVETFGVGTPVTGDDYVMRSGREESPVWWLFGCDSERAVTFTYGLDVVNG